MAAEEGLWRRSGKVRASPSPKVTSPIPPPLAMQVSAALRWREQRATAARLWNVRRDSHGGLMAQRVRAGLTGRAGPTRRRINYIIIGSIRGRGRGEPIGPPVYVIERNHRSEIMALVFSGSSC